MDYTLHKDFSEIKEQEWNEFLKGAVTDTPFQRYEYQSAWWAHRGGGEWRNAQLVLISARENDKLIGFAPLFIEEYDGRKALLLNGSIEISDYLDVIVRPDDHARFLSGLLDFLASNLADNWSALDWYNLPDDSPTLAAFKAEAAQRGWTYHEEVYRPTPRIALNGGFDEYLSRIDKKQRHEIRRKLRRAAESGRVNFTIVPKDADIEPELESFFHLMIQEPNKALFLKDVMRHQMSHAIRSAHEYGYLWLAFLEVDGVKAAASLNFDYNNKLWGYNSGVSREYMELSPGWVLMAKVIEWCCENGRHEFDFMRGDEEYKYRFGGVNKYVMRARLTR
ncbi:MAG: GNAT family N-acetyltransferase [Anaerolineaceae bacterium]|jgi:CelD/BcsL family acetyltransferase involved in cellulose biosynthesis|nr:MAG: GNAT family N-acetyltransferase [Anaerolineaceae bacterium]